MSRRVFEFISGALFVAAGVLGYLSQMPYWDVYLSLGFIWVALPSKADAK